ncbi:Diphthamide biosynthesis protein 3 [Orbilia oligospora]|nr:Diphthamide biosynthesis protein 3 [Orbilia oligospora]
MEESIYDEIEIEDMTYDPTLQIFHYPCPCGDRFEIAIGDLREGEDIAVCPGCSLMIRVIFEVVGALSSLSPRRIWIRTLELEEWEEWLLLRLEEEEKEFEIWRCRLFEEGVWESMLEKTPWAFTTQILATKLGDFGPTRRWGIERPTNQLSTTRETCSIFVETPKSRYIDSALALAPTSLDVHYLTGASGHLLTPLSESGAIARIILGNNVRHLGLLVDVIHLIIGHAVSD